MPEMLDSTSRITALCREKNIVIGLMTDGRFSGGSVGLVIGHVGPEAASGGPIALIEDGDTIVVNLNKNTLDCEEISNKNVFSERITRWKKRVNENNGIHPAVGEANTRLLNRMRKLAVSAVNGAGMHPDKDVWVSEPRDESPSKFEPKNIYRN